MDGRLTKRDPRRVQRQRLPAARYAFSCAAVIVSTTDNVAQVIRRSSVFQSENFIRYFCYRPLRSREAIGPLCVSEHSFRSKRPLT